MKLVFISNYFNHHQKPISDSFFSILGADYSFIETARMSQERINLGWADIEVPEYVRYYYENESQMKKCQELIDSADVIIIGSAPEFLLKKALKSRRIIFRYSERPIKNRSKYWLKYIIRFFKWHNQNRHTQKTYLLCASAFSAYDYSKFFLFKGKAYKWGYFPFTYHYNEVKALIDSKKKKSILWVARMIDLKHPEHAIQVAKRLRDDGFSFQMNLIGNGEKTQEIKELISSYSLDDNVHLLGAVKQSEVRGYMEESEIFLFTSNHNEGWGAVLNEAMNSACAVVANARIGSAPFLVQHQQNGLLYDENDIDALYESTKLLLENDHFRKQLAQNAYNTIIFRWNAEQAAKNFLSLAQDIIDGKNNASFSCDQVCSRASVIDDKWFAKR